MPILAHTAQAMIDHAEGKARALGLAAVIAILDEGGHLKAFLRMDGAMLGDIDTAIRKARTAGLFECNSEGVLQPEGSSPHLELSNGGLAPYPGGLPLKCPNGGLAGSLGVSAGTTDEDAQIARAGLDAFEATLL